MTFLAWRLIGAIHPDFREILQRDPYNSLWYLLAASAFTVAVAVATQRRFGGGRGTTAMELAIAPMLLWGILGVIVALMLPGASYLFAWPLFAATMCASWWRRETGRQRIPPVWLAAFAIPTLVLWLPLLQSLEVALTADMLPLCALLLAMVMSLLVMPLQIAGDSRRWIVIGATVVSIGALIRAETAAGFNESRKRPDSLSYVLDADSARAWWVSFDRTTDPWTRAALGERPTSRSFNQFGLTRGAGTLLANAAASPVVPASPVHIVANEPVADGRRVHLHIDRAGTGEMFSLLADTTMAISQMIINGRVLVDGGHDRYSPRYHMETDGTVLRYFGVPAEGVDLRFTVKARGSAILRVITGLEGLPATATRPLPARPADLTSKPFVRTDMTIVGRTVKLDQ